MHCVFDDCPFCHPELLDNRQFPAEEKAKAALMEIRQIIEDGNRARYEFNAANIHFIVTEALK